MSTTRYYLCILTGLLLLLALALPHASAAEADEFNLTCIREEKYLMWSFDNDTYNISIDGSNLTEMTGQAYLVTNLQRNTMHKIDISNTSNSTYDFCVTRPAIWDTTWFYILIFGIFFLLIGIGTRALVFVMVSWFILFYDISLAWAEWGALYYSPIVLTTFTLIGGTFVWLARS